MWYSSKKNKKRRGLTRSERRRKKREQLKNKRLIKKYYWLIPRNVFSRKILKDYDYTWIDWGWSYGWDKAFGWMYLKEFGDAIKEAGQKDFMIMQQKEKYGRCVNYTSGTTQKAFDIINKYEHISEHICYYCGVEAPMTNTGWILPMCFDCYCKEHRRAEKCFPERPRKTIEELREIYESSIMDEPNENGEYHIPESYTIRRYCKGETEDIVYDISDTVRKIRKRIEHYAKNRH